MQYGFFFFFALLSVVLATRSVDITGRWYVLVSGSPGLVPGVCPTADIRHIAKISHTRMRYVSQTTTASSKKPNRTISSGTTPYFIDGIRVSSESEDGVFLIRRRDLLVYLAPAGPIALSRSPFAPKNAEAVLVLFKILKIKPIFSDHTDCKYSPEAVSSLDIGLFLGRSLVVRVFSTVVPTKNLKCYITTATGRNSTAFNYTESFLLNGTLVQTSGLFVIPSKLVPAEAIVTVGNAPPVVYRVVKVGPVIRGTYAYIVAASLNLDGIFVFTGNAYIYERFFKREVTSFITRTYKIERRQLTRIPQGRQCNHVYRRHV